MKKEFPIKSFASKKSVGKSILSALKKAYPEARAISLRDLKIIKTAMGWKSVVLRARCSLFINGRSQILDVFGGWDKEIPEAKRRAFILLKYLWNNGFNQPPLLVPRPLIFDDQTALMLYIGYPGQTLYELLCQKSLKRAGEIFSLAGEWSARLHALPTKSFLPKLSNSSDQLQHKRNLNTFAKTGRSFFKPQNASIALKYSAQILAKRRQIRRQLKSWAIVHNDFHVRNVLTNIEQNEIAIIDFNESRLHDPLDDIAIFLAHLDVELPNFFSRAKSRNLQRRFIKTYQKSRGKAFTRPEYIRLCVHTSWTALKFLQYTLEANPPFPHTHDVRKKLCQIEGRFWQIALNPDKLLKPLL